MASAAIARYAPVVVFHPIFMGYFSTQCECGENIRTQIDRENLDDGLIYSANILLRKY